LVQEELAYDQHSLTIDAKMQKISLMMISITHMKLFWMLWQTKRANYSLCVVVVEPAKHLFRQCFCFVYEGKAKLCL
jgi:hypothetical protein